MSTDDSFLRGFLFECEIMRAAGTRTVTVALDIVTFIEQKGRFGGGRRAKSRCSGSVEAEDSMSSIVKGAQLVVAVVRIKCFQLYRGIFRRADPPPRPHFDLIAAGTSLCGHPPSPPRAHPLVGLFRLTPGPASLHSFILVLTSAMLPMLEIHLGNRAVSGCF
jgi:hypothetical protein